jgi:hypothetical protein
LAERLAAMELPDRGVVLAEQALERGTSAQRPRLALGLATLRLAAGDAAGALLALDSAVGAPEDSVARGLLAARAKARLGAAGEAVGMLRGLGLPGLRPLAALLAERQDWAGASDALAALAAAQAEPAPRDVLDAAAFAALGGDAERLAGLRSAWLGRMGEGMAKEAFGLLTADPIRGLSDLPRLQRELDLFRGFPHLLEAFRTAALSSR